MFALNNGFSRELKEDAYCKACTFNQIISSMIQIYP